MICSLASPDPGPRSWRSLSYQWWKCCRISGLCVWQAGFLCVGSTGLSGSACTSSLAPWGWSSWISWCIWKNICTVMIQCFRTDRSGRTVQTQIRLPLEEQSDQGLHCLQCRLQPLDAYSTVKPPCTNFRVITANFSGVRIFRIFTVYHKSVKILDTPKTAVIILKFKQYGFTTE